MNMEFNADLFRIAYLNVSTDASRYYLCGVLIQPAKRGEAGAYMVASDGSSMLVIHDESAVNVPENGVTLTLGAKGKPGKLFTSGAKGKNRVEWDGQMARVDRLLGADETATPQRETLGAVPLTAIDGAFPDWRRVMPRQNVEQRGEFPQFDMPVIGRMVAVGEALAALYRQRQLPMAIYHLDAASPALVKWGSDMPVVGVVMPMRGTYEPNHPSWL
jgi:hypothetical protein